MVTCLSLDHNELRKLCFRDLFSKTERPISEIKQAIINNNNNKKVKKLNNNNKNGKSYLKAMSQE